jgi:16S rRNA (cytosine967-C5)-methyltransferase
VYSTCSIEPEENEAVVLGFLKSNPGYHLEKTPWSDPDGFVRRYPNLHGTDGFFIAKLKRDLIKNEVNQ